MKIIFLFPVKNNNIFKKGLILMRSEERLKQSYEKQKEIFEGAKQRKLGNLRIRRQQIQTKLLSLQSQLQEVEELIIKEEDRTFQPFSDFREKALLQSEQKRTERIS
jgi:hypothetical protein